MSEVVQRDVDEVKEIASKLGLVCILPMHNELLIDLDIPYDSNRLIALEPHTPIIKVLHDNGLDITNRLITRSNGGRCHVYYKVSKEMSHLERIALQSLFDSDKVREALSLIRVKAGSHAPTALFETTAQAAIVADWRGAYTYAVTISN